MNKKIILACVLLVLAVLIFASCGKKDKDGKNTTASSKSPEISTDSEGNRFVTNGEGVKIPVTTSKDGGVELVGDLITKTAEQLSKEQEQIENKKTSASSKTEKAAEKTTKASSSGGMVIGGGDPASDDENAAVIDWR